MLFMEWLRVYFIGNNNKPYIPPLKIISWHNHISKHFNFLFEKCDSYFLILLMMSLTTLQLFSFSSKVIAIELEVDGKERILYF